MEKIYTKPEVEAKNAPTGSYAAGCPAKNCFEWGGLFIVKKVSTCKQCERTA